MKDLKWKEKCSQNKIVVDFLRLLFRTYCYNLYFRIKHKSIEISFYFFVQIVLTYYKAIINDAYIEWENIESVNSRGTSNLGTIHFGTTIYFRAIQFVAIQFETIYFGATFHFEPEQDVVMVDRGWTTFCIKHDLINTVCPLFNSISNNRIICLL